MSRDTTGRKRPPPSRDDYRRTEVEVGSVAGVGPKSVFQIGGAGAVGTASLRGMPHLTSLREAGFAVWPFDGGRLPTVLEIYPRLLTGAVVKSSGEERAAYLREAFPLAEPALSAVAGSSEDAFDAAVSALVMDRHRHRLSSLPLPRDELDRVEGRIWSPAVG